LNSIHKKVKHLNHTLIVWAEDNKYKRHRNDDYIIPPRKENKIFVSEWKDDLKFVTKLDRLLSDDRTLTRKELQMCNQLYEFYSGVYEKRN
tara:strand:+ start:5375 stop:5647 length:273 start_codon:yes stop_codon:yes gene_type:complete